MDAEITYRWMGHEDGMGLLRLHRRAILLEGMRAYAPDIARSWAYGLNPAGYAGAAANGEAIEVAEMHGAVIGFCGTKHDEIKGLYVDPAFARRGVGAGLLKRALGRLRAEGHERVRVSAALSGAPFYEAMGFAPIRHRLHRTRGGADMRVIEMERAEPACA